MNKKLQRPPYILLILIFVLGTLLSGIFIIMIDTPLTKYKYYPSIYMTWLKSECIIIVIYLILLASTFYLLMWYYDKRHNNDNHDS